MQIKTAIMIACWAGLCVAMAQEGIQPLGQVRKTIITPETRINQIQAGYQHGLDDLSETTGKTIKMKDVDGNTITVNLPARFGMKRMATIMVLHDKTLRETNVVYQDDYPKFAVRFYAVSAKGKPLTAQNMRIHRDVGRYSVGLSAEQASQITDFAVKQLPTLQKIDLVVGRFGDLDVEARPLRLSRKECLSCHSGSNVGDPLAIMVYTVKHIKG